MKSYKALVMAIVTTMALVSAFSFNAWGATASFEMAFSNLTLTLTSNSETLVPNSVSGYAQVSGTAGAPLETIPDYLRTLRYGTYNLSDGYYTEALGYKKCQHGGFITPAPTAPILML
jgi:hypothetical protein